MRALTEAAQTRLTLISGSRDDVFPTHYETRVSTPLSIPPSATQDYQSCSQPHFEHNFKHNLTQLADAIQQAGYTKLLVFDHTKAELNIPVVQCFIPGMPSKIPGQRT